MNENKFIFTEKDNGCCTVHRILQSGTRVDFGVIRHGHDTVPPNLCTIGAISFQQIREMMDQYEEWFSNRKTKEQLLQERIDVLTANCESLEKHLREVGKQRDEAQAVLRTTVRLLNAQDPSFSSHFKGR